MVEVEIPKEPYGLIRGGSGIFYATGDAIKELLELNRKDPIKCCARAAVMSHENSNVIFLHHGDAQRILPRKLGISSGKFMVPEFGLVYTSDGR